MKKETNIKKEVIAEKETDNQKKKKHEKTPSKDNKDYSRGYWVVLIAVVVSIFLIVISNTMLIFFSIFSTADMSRALTVSYVDTKISDVSRKAVSSNSKEVANTATMTQSEKVESTLLASGVSIIGIAIAVWAGLNIIKALEKNQYKKLKEEMHKIEDERKNFSLATLKNSVSNLNDELNKFLFKKLMDLNNIEYSDVETISKINIIELRFQELFNKHYGYIDSVIVPSEYDDLLSEIDMLISKIEELSDLAQPVIGLYLNVRCAETHFYLGYDVNDKRNNIEQMKLAIKFYLKSFPKMKNPDSIDVKSDWFESDIKLNTYLLNTIGEAYSEIINNENRNSENDEKTKLLSDKEYTEIASKAMDCFNTMDSALNEYKNPKIHRELYYRDYGCAIERKNGIVSNIPSEITYETIEKIANIYQKSINVAFKESGGSKSNYKPFKVYLSIIHKYCDKLFYVISKKGEKGKYTILPDADELKKCFDHDSIEWLKKQSSKIKAYLDIAVAKFPDSMEFLKYKAFYYRDIALTEFLGGNRSLFEEARNSMENVLAQLKDLILEENYDSFMESIICQCNQLCEYKNYLIKGN